MKTPIAVALAGVMAVSSMAFTSVDANAKQKWPHKPYHHHHHHKYHGGGNVGAGIVFGMVAGALASQAFAPNYYYNPYPRAYYPPPPPRGYGYGYQASYNNAHVQWCLSRYKTYNPATNTYFRKVGVPAVCVSPF